MKIKILLKMPSPNIYICIYTGLKYTINPYKLTQSMNL